MNCLEERHYCRLFLLYGQVCLVRQRDCAVDEPIYHGVDEFHLVNVAEHRRIMGPVTLVLLGLLYR